VNGIRNVSNGNTAKPRIGLALGSGSARGWAHIGVIQALEEAGIEPEIVCGSSLGALVGAAFVTGSLEDLETWARRINWIEMMRLLDVRLAAGGLIEGRRLMSFFRDLFGDRAIEDLDRPFATVATDLASGREIWLRSGSVIDAVHASVALPGIIAPVETEHGRLLDGGLVNPVPVTLCRALGAEVIIAVNLNGDLVGRRQARRRSRRKRLPIPAELLERVAKEIPGGLIGGAGQLAVQLLGEGPERPGYFDVVMGAIAIMQDQITRSRMAGNPPDVLLEPRLREIALLEFNRADEAIAEGRNSVTRALPALNECLNRSG
jgi:NTE family protein